MSVALTTNEGQPVYANMQERDGKRAKPTLLDPVVHLNYSSDKRIQLTVLQ